MAKCMNMAAFIKTAEYGALSIRQQLFVRSYLESKGDRQFSTCAAYEIGGANPTENARTFAYQVLRQKKVITALNKYFRKSSREIFVDQLQTDIAAAKPGSAARARLRGIYAQIVFGIKV